MQIRGRGICKECGEEFFVDSENCGTDESLCEECANWFLDMAEDIQRLRNKGRESEDVKRQAAIARLIRYAKLLKW